MNISSTPFIRNDYWPDYNDIDILNKRIDEAENETSLVNIRLTADIENVSNNLNSYKNEMADTVITNNIIVNNLNANYAIGKYANFINTNTDNAYIENLTVNRPVFDLTLNTPHVENITSIGGNFYDANMFNVAIENITGSINDSTITNSTLVNAILDGNGVLGNVEINNTVINTANVAELFVNTSIEPITSSAALGYDSEGRVIPIKAVFDVGFPENANYLYTDQHGTAFKGVAATEVGEVNNLVTAHAVKNAVDNLSSDVNNNFNNLADDVNNSFNGVNNTANNLLDNVEYLKGALGTLLSLPVADVSGWVNSTSPINIKGIYSFKVSILEGSQTAGTEIGNGAKLRADSTELTLGIPGIQWTKANMSNMFYGCNLLNSSILIPSGVTNLSNTFNSCTNLNQNIFITNGVRYMDNTFSYCINFNQNILIPNSVRSMCHTFDDCRNFNQNILIPNSVNNMYGTFEGCYNFNQSILLPNSIDNMDWTFHNCLNLNRNILIPNSVTSMYRTFDGCIRLNITNMYIYSWHVYNMQYAFNKCNIKYIHIPTSVPKDTSSSMYNSLVNGYTGITFSASNIFNDLPVDPEQWPPV